MMAGYLRNCYARGLQDSTIESAEYNLLTFIRWWPVGRCIETITYEDAESFAVFMRRNGIAETTLKNKLCAFKSMMKYAKERGIINHVEVVIPKPQEPEIIPLSKEQIKQIYSACLVKKNIGRIRDYTMMRFIEETGIRVGELLRMETSHINRVQGMISIVKTKNKRARTVYLTPKMKMELTSYLDLRQHFLVKNKLKSNYVWISTHPPHIGGCMSTNTFQQSLTKYGEQAGIDIRVSPHTFRHTFAKNYIQAGGDIFTLQELLGHSSLDMVRRYVRLFSKERRDNYLKVMARIKK